MTIDVIILSYHNILLPLALGKLVVDTVSPFFTFLGLGFVGPEN